MPSTSKTQQRLMGVAYAVKKGDMQFSDVDSSYRDKVKELVDGMTLKQLKDFAETSHEGLPDKVEESFKKGDFYTWNGVEWDPKRKNNYKVSKKVEIVRINPNGDVVGRTEGTSDEFIIRNPEKTLKKIKENIQAGNFDGMGPILLPTPGVLGSGDVPSGQGDAEKEYKKKRKAMKHVNTFESFVNSPVDESKKDKIYMALGDMEDWMPDDPEVQDEYYAITNVKDMANFFEEYADTDVLQSYGLTYKDLKDLAKAALNSNESKRQTKVNEEYIELPSLMEPADDMVEAFKQWYMDTLNNWEDFKDNMAEETVDEAAKNAQMEILAYLSNEMNDVIKDRKFKVRADFK